MRRIVRLRADQREDQLVVGLIQAGRIDDVRVLDAVDEVGESDAPEFCRRARLGMMWYSGTWPPCTVTVETPETRFSGGLRS